MNSQGAPSIGERADEAGRRLYDYAEAARDDVRRANRLAPQAASLVVKVTIVCACTFACSIGLCLGGLMGPGCATLLSLVGIAGSLLAEVCIITMLRSTLARLAFEDEPPRARRITPLLAGSEEPEAHRHTSTRASGREPRAARGRPGTP